MARIVLWVFAVGWIWAVPEVIESLFSFIFVCQPSSLFCEFKAFFAFEEIFVNVFSQTFFCRWVFCRALIRGISCIRAQFTLFFK